MITYQRRRTLSVNIGGTPLGSDYPIRVQSMTSTSTMDTEASVAQCQRIADAGAHYVRLTAQGVREAINIGVIRSQLRQQGCNVPLVADIHFNPKAAFEAARQTDKVRINPGNFVDVARTFKKLTFTDEEYQQELLKIREALLPFIALCRENGTAVRLGVNHGSLSDRIMSRYGDTPAGMVESVMEFLRVFVAEGFLNVVISIKASNVTVMVETVRRLVVAMDREDMHFPLHLGVTEAGDGEDGRVKSAVGIGTLLNEGLGDTIRVSLSEEPELEIPVANKLVDYVRLREGEQIAGTEYPGYDAITPQRRKSAAVGGFVGGTLPPIVVAHASALASLKDDSPRPDVLISDGENIVSGYKNVIPANKYTGQTYAMPLILPDQLAQFSDEVMKWVEIGCDASDETLQQLLGRKNVIVLLPASGIAPIGKLQAALHRIASLGIDAPVIPWCNYDTADVETLQVQAASDLGTLMMNGFRDGLCITAPQISGNVVVRCAFGILQSARLRMSKTEYISCPSCGRTLFDLQSTVREVKAVTKHLKHLKIGIMGCIVNGPGEMADADYGYVGAAAGKISLYKGKECVEKNIPQAEAPARLVALIKSCGDWIDE